MRRREFLGVSTVLALMLSARQAPAFVRESSYRKPPFGSVEIDWSHPLANGLVSAVLLNESGGGPMDLATMGPGSLFGTSPPVWATSPVGPCVTGTSNTSGNGIKFLAPPKSADITGVSSTGASAAFLVVLSQASKNALVDRHTGGGVGWEIGDINDNGWIGVQQETQPNLQAAITAPSLGVPHMIVVAWNPNDTTASNVSFYVDGVLTSHVFNNNGTANNGLSDATGDLVYMSQTVNAAESMIGSLVLGMLWKNRLLGQADALMLSRAPYDFLRQRFVRRYFMTPQTPAASAVPQRTMTGVGL